MPILEGEAAEALRQEGVDSLLDAVEGYVAYGLQDFAFAATDLPEFLADTSPVVAAAQPTRQILRAACRSYARGGGPQNLPGFDAIWGGICEPYLESIGEDPSGGSLALPFTGGQCYGVQYRVVTAWTADPLGAQTNEQQVSARVVGTYRGEKQANQTTPVGIELQGSPGAAITRLNITSLPDEALGSFRIQSVSVLGGGVDSCGNPPPLYDPPRIRPGLPGLPRFPIDFPGIGPIDIEVDFDPDGNINIDLPDVGVGLTVEDPFGLGGDEGGEPGGGGGPPPGDVGSPSDPVGIGPGGEAEGEAPEGSVLVGVRMQIVGIPESRSRYTDEVYRGAYYLYMGVPGLLDHDPAGAMARVDQFVFAEKDNLTAWRVRANSRYELITTPYYRPVEG